MVKILHRLFWTDRATLYVSNETVSTLRATLYVFTILLTNFPNLAQVNCAALYVTATLLTSD